MAQAAALLAVAAGLTACSKPEPAVKTPEPPVAFDVLLSEGESVYAENCARCHSDGTASPSTPPLIGSAVAAGPPEAIIRIVLHGQRNVTRVNGVLFNGVMPGMDYMTDREIAASITYMRAKFENNTDPVQPADVAAVRAAP
jgi:mono/diheme cytochrome c family protein